MTQPELIPRGSCYALLAGFCRPDPGTRSTHPYRRYRSDERRRRKRTWLVCDDAAVNVGFPNAGWPNEEVSAPVARQFGGAREGEDLIILSADTNTGTVYCMLDFDYKVLLYKFNGREIIDRV